MIDDLSKTLRAILSQPGTLGLEASQIVFDPPTDQFDPGDTTVDLFLYDIRENAELRSNELEYERANGTVTIRQPPLRVACSYLVTAWPVAGDGNGGDELSLQEHKLLGQILQLLSQYPTIPSQFLQGSLANQEPPLPKDTARADGLQNPAELWTAMTNQMRASLTITLTIAVDVFEPEEAPGVIASQISFGERTSPDEETISTATLEEFFRIGGVVTDSNDDPVEGATVTITENNLSAETDSQGRYRIGLLSTGNYTLQVVSGIITHNVNISVPPSDLDEYNVKLP